MIASTIPLFLVSFGASGSAHVPARFVPRELPERTVRPVGGYALQAVVNGFCPNDLDVCGSDTFCCPTSLTCIQAEGQQQDNRCCPGTEDCSPGLRTSPYCADDSWSLWDKTQGGIYADGYFCCGPGNVGLLDGTCIVADTLVSPTLEAMALAPGGAVLTTATSIVATAATSVAGTTVVDSITTTSSPALKSTSTVEAPSSSAISVKGSTTGSSATAVTTGSSTSPSSAGLGVSSTSISAPVASTKAASDAKSYKNAEYGAAAFGVFVAAML